MHRRRMRLLLVLFSLTHISALPWALAAKRARHEPTEPLRECERRARRLWLWTSLGPTLVVVVAGLAAGCASSRCETREMLCGGAGLTPAGERRLTGCMNRAVLQAEVSRDDIDDAALRCDWQLTNIMAGTAQQPAQMIYAARQGRTLLYLVEDGRLDVLYFASTGEGADEVMAQVRAELRCCAADSHVALLGDFDDVMRVRRGLGVMVLQSEGPDEATVALLARALRHDEMHVRSLALTAASYAPWPALRPVIEELASGDPLPAVRAGAAQLLQTLFPQAAS